MKTVLITGANKSIGFETTKQLLKQGFMFIWAAGILEKVKRQLAN